MLSCLCLGKGITGAQLLSGVERVCRCCAPALPWPLVCPIPLCPKGKLALPEASKRYFPSMAKHQGRFESALPQCLSVNGNGFGVFFLPRMPRVSLCCCWAVELTPQELRAVRNRTLVLMELAFLRTPGTDRALLVQPAPPQCSRNSVTLQLWWKCTSQNAF